MNVPRASDGTVRVRTGPYPAGVPPVRVPLECSLTAAQAVLAPRGAAHPFALVGAWAGVEAILGCEPLRPASDPFAALASPPAARGHGVIVGGGWFGTWGYRLGRRIERLPPGPPAPVEVPEARVWWYDYVVVFDGERWWLEALSAAAAEEALPGWQARLGMPPTARSFSVGEFSLTGAGAVGHLERVAECVDRIASGEIFQANLALRLEAPIAGDALDLFAVALDHVQPRF